MKKIVLAVLICMFAIASISSAAESERSMAVGVQGLSLTTNAVTMPTIQIQMSPGLVGEAGFAFANRDDDNNFSVALAGKFTINKKDSIKTQWGLGLNYTSNPAFVQNSSLLGVTLFAGLEWFVNNSISIEGNVIPLGIWMRSFPGNDTTTISIFNSVNSPSAIIGAHYYL